MNMVRYIFGGYRSPDNWGYPIWGGWANSSQLLLAELLVPQFEPWFFIRNPLSENSSQFSDVQRFGYLYTTRECGADTDILRENQRKISVLPCLRGENFNMPTKLAMPRLGGRRQALATGYNAGMNIQDILLLYEYNYWANKRILGASANAWRVTKFNVNKCAVLFISFSCGLGDSH